MVGGGGEEGGGEDRIHSQLPRDNTPMLKDTSPLLSQSCSGLRITEGDPKVPRLETSLRQMIEEDLLEKHQAGP